MQYNYEFEIASLFVMAIIICHFIFIRQFPVDKTKIFGILLLSCTAECCVNILSCIGLANTALVSQFWNEVLVFAFFVLEGLTSYLLFWYFRVVCEFRGREDRIIGMLGGVPFAVFLLLLAATPFMGVFYYFEDGAYYQGFGADFGYAYIVYYFALNIFMVVRRHRVVNLRTKVIITMYTLVAICMIILQYHVRGVLLTSVGNAVVLLMLYMAMQNPNEMLDVVSGVGNERAFLSQMKNMQNHKNEQTVITLHLRQFHYIHTVLGMDNSNIMLQEIGLYLYHLCGKFHVFRTAVDTFTVMIASGEKAQSVQKAIRERFAKEWIVRQNHIVLDMDMVVQHYPDDFQTIPEYMGICQFLLENVRSGGAQAVVEADVQQVERYRRRLKVEMAVTRAIRERSFEVYYQPIYSVREKGVVSLEALVRLRDEELGYISPDEFIPLAERDGNIIYIGEQVLEQCCQFLSRHVLSNTSLGIRTVQINISMVQCLRQNLSETIVPVLRKYHIPPNMIILELTERTAISAPERLKRHMKELGELGITFAVDDYGSGNANCSYLIQFPFRQIKIDREMVWAYSESKTARIVLENEIRTIQKLGIPLIVEGIENRLQSEEMQRLGVDYMQGYYYGRPLPEKECLRYIREFNRSMEDLF